MHVASDEYFHCPGQVKIMHIIPRTKSRGVHKAANRVNTERIIERLKQFDKALVSQVEKVEKRGGCRTRAGD